MDLQPVSFVPVGGRLHGTGTPIRVGPRSASRAHTSNTCAGSRFRLSLWERTESCPNPLHASSLPLAAGRAPSVSLLTKTALPASYRKHPEFSRRLWSSTHGKARSAEGNSGTEVLLSMGKWELCFSLCVTFTRKGGLGLMSALGDLMWPHDWKNAPRTKPCLTTVSALSGHPHPHPHFPFLKKNIVFFLQR